MYFRTVNQQSFSTKGNMASTYGMTQGTAIQNQTYTQPQTQGVPEAQSQTTAQQGSAGTDTTDNLVPSEIMDSLQQARGSNQEQSTLLQGGMGYGNYGSFVAQDTQGYGGTSAGSYQEGQYYGYPGSGMSQGTQFTGQMGSTGMMPPGTMYPYQGMTSMPGMMFYCPMMYGMPYSPNMYNQQIPMQGQNMNTTNFTGNRQINPVLPLLFYGLTGGLHPYHDSYYDDYYYNHYENYYDNHDDDYDFGYFDIEEED